MGYASEKERKLSQLIREIVYRANDAVYIDDGVFRDKQFSSELVYSRITGNFLKLLGYVNSQIYDGKTIEEITLD